jgi:hypothetical protein
MSANGNSKSTKQKRQKNHNLDGIIQRLRNNDPTLTEVSLKRIRFG